MKHALSTALALCGFSQAGLVLGFIGLMLCLASAPSTAIAGSTSGAGPGEAKRGKVIDFEDEVVEGLNKRPLDSLNQISERNGRRKKPHLYRKRGGFRTETLESLGTLRYTP